jgi:hypothetical protein
LYLLPLLLFLLLSGEAELRSSDKTDRCDIDRGDVEGRRGEESARGGDRRGGERRDTRKRCSGRTYRGSSLSSLPRYL